MWTRRLSESLGAVMDPVAFTKALLIALNNPEVQSSFGGTVESKVRQKVTEIHSTLGAIVEEKVRQEITALRVQLKEKDEVIQKLKTEVGTLQDQVDSMEQYSRRNNLRITGLKEKDNENAIQTTLEMFNDVMKVDPPVCEAEIDRVHRVGRPSGDPQNPRPMLVKFATYRSRSRVVSFRTNLNGIKHPYPIYLNEDLSRARMDQFYRARVAKKRAQINGCWTHDGTLVIKDLNNTIKSANTLSAMIDLLGKPN